MLFLMLLQIFLSHLQILTCAFSIGFCCLDFLSSSLKMFLRLFNDGYADECPLVSCISAPLT